MRTKFAQDKPFKNEYAPGIPSHKKIQTIPTKKNTTWELTIHDHHAKKRGRHFDLRLGDPFTGHSHSWALKAQLPPPGSSTWAIQQPTHSLPYMDFKGIIQDGYGAGKVDIFLRDKTQILDASDDHINFVVNKGTIPQLFTLHRIFGKKWKLFNRTLTKNDVPYAPQFKPKYKTKKYENIDIHNDDEIFMPKIDGAHNLLILPKTGQQVRVISYRKPIKNATGVIEHTFKFKDLPGFKTPKGTGGTVLRAEAFAINPETGEATEASTLAGLLNSKTPLSLSLQKKRGKLQLAPFDVVFYKGKDISNKPYEYRLKVLNQIVNKLPDTINVPPVASTPKDKLKLIKKIKQGQIPLTREGVVAWNLKSSEPPTKFKLRPEFDVYIRDFYPGSGKYAGKAVGGFLYSHTPDGPIVGRVGTGFSDKLRKDMFKHKRRYIGLIARVTGLGVYKRQGALGAIRAPAFIDFHPDKNDPMRMQKIVYN